MMTRRSLRRAGLAVAATGTAAVLAAAPAMAHHCFIPMYSLDAPASANWFPLTAEDGAGFEGYVAGCDAAVDAGCVLQRRPGLMFYFRRDRHASGRADGAAARRPAVRLSRHRVV